VAVKVALVLVLFQLVAAAVAAVFILALFGPIGGLIFGLPIIFIIIALSLVARALFRSLKSKKRPEKEQQQ